MSIDTPFTDRTTIILQFYMHIGRLLPYANLDAMVIGGILDSTECLRKYSLYSNLELERPFFENY